MLRAPETDIRIVNRGKIGRRQVKDSGVSGNIKHRPALSYDIAGNTDRAPGQNLSLTPTAWPDLHQRLASCGQHNVVADINRGQRRTATQRRKKIRSSDYDAAPRSIHAPQDGCGLSPEGDAASGIGADHGTLTKNHVAP